MAWSAAIALCSLLHATPAVADPLDVDVTADSVSEDAVTHVLRATGHVHASYHDIVVTADALSFDLGTRRGELSGHVQATSPNFALTADDARFDLRANRATLTHFSGHWRQRVQFHGESVDLGPKVFVLQDAFMTPCMNPEPDLGMVAKSIRFYPSENQMNFSAQSVAVQVWGHDVVFLPFFNTTIGPRKNPWNTDFVPAFGFDAFQGFLTSTRLDFSFGNGSRGTIPISFSTGRGVSAAFQHVLALGPGNLSNSVGWDTPWAANRGGLRAMNAYRFGGPLGGRWEMLANYREDMNGQPVSRLPELGWVAPVLNPLGLLTLSPELRLGNLYEETSGVQSLRFRAAVPLNSAVWTPRPWFQSWISANPFFHVYSDRQYGVIQADWLSREPLLPDLILSETGELIRTYGDTPFIYDRQLDAERVRLQLDKGFGARLSTTVMASWSRINQQGPFSIEDLMLAATYNWNCFGITLELHPLILGVDTHFQLLNF
ncbi:MAG TPA: hypothetical protein V6D47_07735 [Oscillatoriaceae cyanobacterium]